VVSIKFANSAKFLRPLFLDRLVFGNQKTPLLQIVPLYRSIEAVVAHRYLLPRCPPDNELSNLHSNDGYRQPQTLYGQRFATIVSNS
jgi:hypothetical protein